MDCNEARSALSGEREIDAARRAAARAHVATCAVCQARADQLASAILSEAEEELSCAECLARLDLQGAAILTDGRAGASAAPGAGAPADRRALDPDDLVRAHLARCPECAEAWQLLATGLADLAADRLPTPETWPRFDLSFARDPQPNAPRPAGWWPRARVRLDASTPLRGLERLFARWRVRSAAPAWQGLSRASLAGLALLIVLGLAWLLRSGTSLPRQIRSLSPFDTPTPSQADIAATQTMAVEMGIDWVDAAGAGGARTPTPDGLAPGSGRGTPMGARRASPSPTQGSGTAPAAGPREPDRGRERLATRPPEPTRVEPSAMVTGTLRPRGNIAYPPPPLATRDPYPGPGAPEPRPIAPTAGAATAPAPTPAPEPSLAPEPSAEPLGGALMRYYLDSIGCRLNQAEMEALARRLLAAGHAIVDRPEAAERVLLNTCAVTAEAAREARKRSRRFHRLSPGAEIVLTGCYATLEPEALATLPGVGRVVANARKEDLIALLDPAAAEDPPAYELEPAMRLQRGAGGGHTRAFVKVQDGCDKRCSFCVTTLARGAGRSRPLEAVVDEVEALSRAGYREAVLTGVHLGSYGQDLGRRAGLSELIAALLARTAIPRLRLSSLEPWDIPDGFFALWEDRRLLPHLHLPLQAGCDRTLARMARGVSTAEFRALAARARAAIPDLNLTTDLIAGFPGETEADFEAGLNFVREIGFGHLHVFPYSERPGTAAARMPGRVPVPERKDRARRLIALGETLAAATHARFLGREAEVLWERGDRAPGAGRRQRWTGYTEGYLPVSLDSRQALANQISRVRLVAATAEGLRGRLLAEPEIAGSAGRLSSPLGSRFPARDRCRG